MNVPERPDQAMILAMKIVRETRQEHGDPKTPEEWAVFTALLEVKVANALVEFPPEEPIRIPPR
jgi:hypothetical protein